MSVCVFIDSFGHFVYYFNLKQQILARFVRFSSILHNTNQFKLQNRIFKRISAQKAHIFRRALRAFFTFAFTFNFFLAPRPHFPQKIQVLVPPL